MITKEALEEANKSLDAIPFKGNNYVMVNKRVQAFRSICPTGSITTEIVNMESGVITMRAIVTDDDGKLIATGYAQEKEDANYINKTSYVENCETSAIGRALGFAGIGIDSSICSAEELVNALNNQGGKNNGKNGYPPRDEMMKAIDKKYPAGSQNLKALLFAFQVDSLDKASDAQIMQAYNKATAKK